MHSTVYMNHYPGFSSNERQAVTADLTWSIADMANPDTRLGSVVSGTLAHLGVERLDPPAPSDMLLIGSQQELARRQHNLCVNIGRIVDRAMKIDTPNYAEYSKTSLEDAMLRVAHAKRDSGNQSFIKNVGGVLETFGEDCDDDGCVVSYGARKGWTQRRSEREAKIAAVGVDNVKRYIMLLPEAAIGNKERSREDGLLLWQATNWMIRNGHALNNTAEAKSVEAFRNDMEKNRRAISAVIQDMYEKGLPEQFYLPDDIWEQLIDRKVAQFDKRAGTAS